jgi:UPF0755 protein
MLGRRIAHALLMLIILLATLLGTAQSVIFVYFNKKGPLTQQQTLIIPQGTSLKGIADALDDAGIIDHPLLFCAAIKTLKWRHTLKAGEYSFTALMTPHQIATMMIDGKAVVHRLTIPEGLTSSQIIAHITAEPALLGEIMGKVKEGELLPETYFFSYGDQKQQLIDRMRHRMQQILHELWEKRQDNLPFDTMEEALVLASIVEKETSLDKERPRVASVFINRLRKKMKLQSDPTVIYSLTNGERELGRSLTRSDLRNESPFNTYVSEGLPPSPIANPGKASIAAVLNPLATNDLYFVADGNGGHNFSASLDEHNSNVQKYRTLMKAGQAPERH